MVGGAGRASHGGREQRLAVSSGGRHKGALRENVEHRPSFGGGRSVAPGRWPAQTIRKEVAAVADGSNPKARAPDGAPPAIDERAVAVPGNAVAASVMVREGDNPTESTVGLERRRSNLDRQQPMQLEVAESLRRERRKGEVGSRWGGGQPSRGRVELQWNLCSRVPMAERHSWHLASSMPKLGTEAFLA